MSRTVTNALTLTAMMLAAGLIGGSLRPLFGIEPPVSTVISMAIGYFAGTLWFVKVRT